VKRVMYHAGTSVDGGSALPYARLDPTLERDRHLAPRARPQLYGHEGCVAEFNNPLRFLPYLAMTLCMEFSR
jgi:hypothetical protein